MLVYFFAVALASTVFLVANAAANCSLCQLSDDFASSNGYNCFPLQNGQVACTCPDGHYALNKPCRICERPNICGTDPATLCSEVAGTLPNAGGNTTHYFSCFCTNFTFYVGRECPAAVTTTTSIVTRPSVTTTAPPVPTTTATAPILTITTTTTPAPTSATTTTRVIV